MEVNKQIIWPLLFTAMIIFITLLQKLIRTSLTRSPAPSLNLPPGPRKLPIFGNMHNIIGAPIHRRLTELANTYGPLMHLKLGPMSMVVVTSPEVASQTLRVFDAKFVSKPNSTPAAGEVFMYRFKDGAFAPYGECWRQMRKVITVELLSSRSVQSFRPLREAVVAKMVREIGESARSERPVNLSRMLYSVAFEILSGAAFGKMADKYQTRFMDIVNKMGAVVNQFSIVDLFPSMRFLQMFKRSSRTTVLEKLYKEADEVLEEIIGEHRAAKGRRLGCQEEEEELDLVDILLNLQEHDQNEEFQITDESIKAVIMDLFGAGYSTVSVTMEWAFSEMLRNPRVLLKAQAEVREVHDMKGAIHESHLHELKYLNQVIRENFRMHPTAPFLLPRENSERCEINGYEIPTKALVFTNIWAIGKDPKVWKDPDSFNPERFRESLIDYKGAHCELLPFGAGRRICPGMSFGIANIEITLANLLCHFDWKLPAGMKGEELDMTEATGFVLKRKSELCLIPILHKEVV